MNECVCVVSFCLHVHECVWVCMHSHMHACMCIYIYVK